MTSRAKRLWDTRSQERLDELEQIHSEIRGPGRGRRWYTREFNLSLFVALVAQFQLYCRNLHDDAVDVYLSEADPRWADVLGTLLTQGRKLDNAEPAREHTWWRFWSPRVWFCPCLKIKRWHDQQRP